MDPNYAKLLANYVCSKYGVSLPNIVFTDFPLPGAYRSSTNTIFLDKNTSNVFTLLHELGHKILFEKGIKFSNSIADEIAANRFAKSEIENLGLVLESGKDYVLKIDSNDPVKLYSIIRDNVDGLGINLKGYSISGNRLNLVFTTSSNVSDNMVHGDVKFLSPIVWAIIGLATLFGLNILSWQISKTIPEMQNFMQIIVPVIVLGISAWAIVSFLSKE